MKERLSNLSTSSSRTEHYALALSGIGSIIASIYQLVTRDYVLAMAFLLFGLLLLGLSFLLYRYNSIFYDVYIDDNFIYISKGDDYWTEVELDNICSVYYHPFFIFGSMGESNIVIEFFKEMQHGKKIIFTPTNLDNHNKYKRNRNIIGLIEEKIKNYKKKKAIEFS